MYDFSALSIPAGICQAPVIWWHLIIIEPPVWAIKVSPVSIKGWVSGGMAARTSSSRGEYAAHNNTMLTTSSEAGGNLVFSHNVIWLDYFEKNIWKILPPGARSKWRGSVGRRAELGRCRLYLWSLYALIEILNSAYIARATIFRKWKIKLYGFYRLDVLLICLLIV